MKSMDRRLKAIEKKHPEATDRTSVICICDHLGDPAFAWCFDGQAYCEVSRMDEESAEEFLDRCDAISTRSA